MLLLQEQYPEPWKRLVITMLLNRTNGHQVRGILGELFAKYPTREALGAADVRALEGMLHPLGLKGRASHLVKSAHRLGALPGEQDKQLDFIRTLPGCSDYAADAWRMLVLNDHAFWPGDKNLCLRMIELRLAPRVVRDFNSRIYLQVLEDDRAAYLVGPKDDNSRDLVRVRQEDFKHFTPVNHPVEKLIDNWLDYSNRNYIPLSERGKEIIMLVISILREKAKLIGKFTTIKAALEASPEGAEIIQVPKDLDGFSLVALTEIHNIVAPEGKKMKGFPNKKAAIERIEKVAKEVPAAGAAEAAGAPQKDAAAAQRARATINAAKKAIAEPAQRIHYTEAAVISVLVDKNPKRESSDAGQRFALYKNGMTVGAALAAGVLRADISWDTRHGFISIKEA
jgi:hypothetical protein